MHSQSNQINREANDNSFISYIHIKQNQSIEMRNRCFKSMMLFIGIMPFKVLSQNTLITLTVPVFDKVLAESINSSIISGMEDNSVRIYLSNDLSIESPISPDVKLVLKNNGRKKIKSITASILWHDQMDVASIFSLVPNYDVNDTPFYLFEGDLKVPSAIDLRALIWQEFIQRSNSSAQKSNSEKYTSRTISFNESDCLHNFPLSVIPQMLYLKATQEFSLGIFSDAMLENEIRPKDLEENYVPQNNDLKNDNGNVNQKAGKPLGVQSLVLFEEWKDTTYQYLGMQNDGIHSKVKKVKSIGLIFPGNKIAWFNYDEYKNMMLNRDAYDKKLFDAYKLIFESHFSKLMNAKR